MEVTYFDSYDLENTDKVLRIAKKYAKQNEINTFVIASTTGYTAERAVKILGRKNIIIVTHVGGFQLPNRQQFPEELRNKLEKKGIKVLTTAHALGGINKLKDDSIGETIANTLRIFSEGVKVCVEVSAMAADAGLVRTDEDIIAIAGTGRGADTSLVIRPSYSRNLFDLKVNRILAKPLF